VANELERFFAPEFHVAIRGLQTSPHPVSQQLAKGMERFAYLFGKDSDLEKKLEGGEVELGKAFDCYFLPDGTSIKIKRDLLCSNILVVGTVGSGKTTFILSILKQLRKME